MNTVSLVHLATHIRVKCVFYLNDNTGQFTVETRRAGVGTLLIRVHGLKDSFRIEAHPLSKDNPRTLFAAYNPMVKGNYVVFVRWSGNHVPGSPFNVTIRPKPGEWSVYRACVLMA